MLAYQQRVVDEKAELDDRAERLSVFLNSAAPIDAAERGRMQTQLAIMNAYCAILEARIAAF